MQDSFPDRLRTLRKHKQISQAEFAARIKVHPTHVSRYETGRSRPTADTLQRMAEVLGVSSDYLIQGVNDQVATARFDDRELLWQFEEVQKLPDEDKLVIKKLVEAFLTKKQLQALAAR